MVVNKNSKVFNLLFTTNDGASIGSGITSTCITKVTIGKGMISKLVPPLMGLTSLVVTTSWF
jgi:hypothetical protein